MSQKLPALTSRELLRALAKAGFYVHHQTGSHIQLKHQTDHDLRLTVPFHSRDLPRAVVRSIIVQAGLSVDELRDLL